VATSRHAEPVTQHGGVLEPLARLVDAAREDTSQTKSRPKAASQFNPDDGSGGHQSFVLDGEAVLLDAEGISDFNAPHSRKRDAEVQLYAFDFLAADGDDLRRLPLSLRKTNLARILARRIHGIHVAPFEQGEIGPDLFAAVCRMGWRAWSPSTAIGPIAPAASTAGSRSRTGSIRRSAG
jgi:hypothetical protein